jgi:hypothetical protein
VSMDVSLGLHTFFFFLVAGVVVDLEDWLPHTWFEVCSAYTDKVEIKCIGSVGEKTPTEPKLCSFFFNLGHI